MDILLYLIILIIPALAQGYVSLNYKKYQKEENKSGMTGFEVARKILDKNGLKDIYIVEVKGYLTDHYDPKRKTVRLSTDVYHSSSISSAAIASHECGHAIQDKEGYLYMKIRSIIFPIVNFATSISYFIIFLGILFESLNMIWLGIICVSLGLFFQIITLPVEINASKRAEKEIKKLALTTKEEISGVKKVLTAAALTYVAGVLSNMLELLRLILIFGNRDD